MTTAPATTATVLVIEDEEALLLTMAHHLRREGYDVLTAARGDDGLRMAREHEPNVIVLDLMLPGVDGMGICRALRRDTQVPIIMVTALGGESGEVRVLPLWPKAGRPAKRVIVRSRRGGRAPLCLLPGLVLHEADGSYTEAAEDILRGGAALSLSRPR